MSNDANLQAMFISTVFIFILSTVVACKNYTVSTILYEHLNQNIISNAPYTSQVSIDYKNYNNVIEILILCKDVCRDNLSYINLVRNGEYRNWVRKINEYRKNNNSSNYTTDIEVTSFVFLPTKRRLLSEDYYDSELDLEIDEQFTNENQPAINNPYKKTITNVLETEKDNDDEKEEYEEKNEDVAKVKSNNDEEEEEEDDDYEDEEEDVVREASDESIYDEPQWDYERIHYRGKRKSVVPREDCEVITTVRPYFRDYDAEESVDLSSAENSAALFVLVCSLFVFTRVIHSVCYTCKW